jgi:hypothetical protein
MRDSIIGCRDSQVKIRGYRVDLGEIELSIRRPSLAAPYVAPRNLAEAELAELRCGVLGFDQVGVHDESADLGGDSRLAMRLASRIFDHHGIRIPIIHLIESKTVAAQAATVTNKLGEIRER